MQIFASTRNLCAPVAKGILGVFGQALRSCSLRLIAATGRVTPRLKPSRQHIRPDISGPGERVLSFDLGRTGRETAAALHNFHRFLFGDIAMHGGHVHHVLVVDEAVTGVRNDFSGKCKDRNYIIKNKELRKKRHWRYAAAGYAAVLLPSLFPALCGITLIAPPCVRTTAKTLDFASRLQIW